MVVCRGPETHMAAHFIKKVIKRMHFIHNYDVLLSYTQLHEVQSKHLKL